MVGFCTVIHKAQPKHALVASFFLYIIYRVINIWGACKIVCATECMMSH